MNKKTCWIILGLIFFPSFLFAFIIALTTIISLFTLNFTVLAMVFLQVSPQTWITLLILTILGSILLLVFIDKEWI